MLTLVSVGFPRLVEQVDLDRGRVQHPGNDDVEGIAELRFVGSIKICPDTIELLPKILSDPDDERLQDDPLFLQVHGSGAWIPSALFNPVGNQDDDVPAIDTGRKIFGRLLKGICDGRCSFGSDRFQNMLDPGDVVFCKRNLQPCIVAILRRILFLMTVKPQGNLKVACVLQAVEEAAEKFHSNIKLCGILETGRTCSGRHQIQKGSLSEALAVPVVLPAGQTKGRAEQITKNPFM